MQCMAEWYTTVSGATHGEEQHLITEQRERTKIMKSVLVLILSLNGKKELLFILNDEI
jgi:hypothetical protein